MKKKKDNQPTNQNDVQSTDNASSLDSGAQVPDAPTDDTVSTPDLNSDDAVSAEMTAEDSSVEQDGTDNTQMPAEPLLADEEAAPLVTESFLESEDETSDMQADVEEDKPQKTKKPRKSWSKKKKIIISSVAVVLAVLLGFASYVYAIWSNPMGQFDKVSQQVSPTPSADETSSEQTPGSTPTIDPYDELVAKADFGLLDNIVNIMLIGVDYAEERVTWSGKHAYHSDVMIVLSINTDTKQVSMISLPRDTYAKIPGISGIYKLNASIDCGGGWPTEAGFQKVCEAASWMLGDIPVEYYYAVDMSAVKGLVDAIGGLYYDVDLDFKIQGRSYTKGNQYMDGQAVLDYLRVRKNLAKGEEGDLRRIDRQKKMLIAIFEKIKDSDLLAKLPDILGAFEGNLYTNTTLAQTAALAAYAYNVDGDNIQMYSMGGNYHDIFNWRFVLTDQKDRVELIKKIYGVDVPQYKDYSPNRAMMRWEKMQAEVIKPKARDVLNQVKAILDADAQLPEYPTPAPVDPTIVVDPTVPTPEPTPPPDPALYRKYGADIWDIYNRADAQCQSLTSLDNLDALQAANLQLKADIETLCSMFSIGVPNWEVNYEKNENEIYVNFN